MKKNRLIFFVIIGVLAVLIAITAFLGLQSANRGSFYIIKSTPADGQSLFVSPAQTFTFEFNKSIKNLGDGDIKIDPSLDIRVEVQGTKLTLLPYSEFTQDSYTIDLSKVTAADGDKLRNDKIKFSVTNKSSGFGTEQFSQRRYPVLAVLHYDDHWAIHEPDSEIVIDPPAGSKIPFYLYIDTILNDTEQRQSLDAQHALLEQYRQDALNYIKSKGFNPDDYPLYYTEPYLQTKYDKSVSQPNNSSPTQSEF